MSSIDERIVRLKFDNQAFEQGIARSRDSLGRFTKQLETPSSGKGLDNVSAAITKVRDGLGRFASESQKDFSEVDAASKKLSLEGVGNGVQAVADKFKALSVVGVTALATITSRAVSAGLSFAKSFTTQPISDGFHEYETNLNSIQTILANTQASGATLKDVEASLNDLNHYSDQTIYNFSEMAKNIGTFTAAGVDLKTSAASIKGIANLAALSGSNSEQASGAMYQLSQAISSGRVSLEDWNSVVNAGMGGTVFQRALAQTAEKMGTLSDGAVKLSGKMKNVSINGKSFRESITAKPGQDSWLTSKVLTATLQQFTGDLSDAQLKAQGFSAAQIKAIQAQAKTAKEAATQVKTFSQLVDTTKEAIGSGWSQTFQTIFGDFTEAKGLFTGISNAVNGVISSSSNARNKMLADWKKLGGRDDLIKGITNGVKALASVIKPIHDAFREIFPATTGKQLADLTKRFADFMSKLKIGSDTAEKLKRTFAGVFAVFGIAWDVIKGVGSVLAHLFGVITHGSGGFLNLTARVGDFLVGLKKAIESGNGLTKFFQGLGVVLAVPIKLLQAFAHWVAALFEGFDTGKAESGISGVTQKLGPFGKLLELVRRAWSKLVDMISNAGSIFGPISDKITSLMQSVGPAITNFFSGLNFSDVLNGINTGLFAGLLLLVRKFINKIKGGGELASGFIETITGPFEALTGTLESMQGTLKATTLLEIAIAIGILTLSVSKLSTIDSDGLTRASTAMAGMFAQLIGSLAIFQKFIGTAGFAKMPFVMGSLILLAGAVLILAQAVKQLSTLDWNSLAKGLTGVTVLLGGLFAVMKFMPPASGMISTGLGLIALSAAIKILASAVGDLSGLSWNDLAKGLVGVGAILGALILFTKFAKADAGGIAQGVGIVLLAAGIKILASAVQDMSGMSWGEIAKGLVTLAGSLAIITAALMLIPPTAPLAAAGVLLTAISLGMVGDALDQMAQMSWANIASSLTVMLGAMAIIAAALILIPPTAPLAALAILGVAAALLLIAQTLTQFAAFSWEEIGKSMLLLFGTLAMITAAMLLMTTALPGAAALLLVAAALAVLQPVLLAFGQMSLAEIGKSLLMLAGSLIVIGATSAILGLLSPLIAAFGIALGILGVALLAAGAGVYLFASGLGILAAVGTAGAAAIIGIVSGLIGLIPKLMTEIGKGVVAFAKVIATAGPAIFSAMTTVIGSMIKAIAVLTPQIVTTLLRMLTMLLQKLAQYVPKMVTAGMQLIIGVLNGIAKNIGKMVTAATNVCVNFINGIAKNLPRIIDAGIKLVISFVNGVANGIRNNQAAMNSAGKNLASAIVSGMISGLKAGLSSVISAAKNIASSAISAAKSVLHINSPSKVFIAIGKSVNEGFVKGLKSGDKDKVDKAFNDMKKQLLDLSKSAKATAAERKKAAAAYQYLTKNLADEHKKLDQLNDKYDAYTEKIKNAQQALADAKKTRDDYNKSIHDEFAALPSIDANTTAASYEKDLADQIEKTKEFSNALQRLRKMGLNDTAYKDLLSKGLSALPFVNDLLSQGQNGVNEINSLDKQLETVAAGLGKTASSELYDAAVNAAAGLVKGLQAQQKAIQHQMDIIADAMVKAIKKKLGIKSPSRVMAEVGGYSAEGVAVGLSEMSGVVAKAAADTGQTAVDSLRKSMSGFSDLITGPVDIQPVITPVLDLSSVKKDAGQIGTVLGRQPISVDSAYSKAAAIANARMAAQEAADIQSSAPAPLTFNQYNNSPKALSSADIYRQTNNQLSRAKGALSTSANKSGR
ncbi:tape measure protein [Streptomyces phage ClubPenguin]|nr:tape measure protein [Streptomyces phage ClubPenguin]